MNSKRQQFHGVDDDTMNGVDDVWIYHERQESKLCGQHALNNLVQMPVFTVGMLTDIAHELDDAEMAKYAEDPDGGINSKDYLKRLQEGSGNVDEFGNFSIQVLQSALEKQYNNNQQNNTNKKKKNGGGGIRLYHLSEKDLWIDHRGKDVTDFQAFLCHGHDHWFAIRKVAGRFWNLNSTIDKPYVVTHYQVGLELQTAEKEGFTVFCVPTGLPRAGSRPLSQYTRKTSAQSTWHTMKDLLSDSKTTAKSSEDDEKVVDPWKDVGTGMRLDGKDPTTTASSSTADTDNAEEMPAPEDMTEEEQVQWILLQNQKEAAAAVAAKTSITTETEEAYVVEVPSEPSADENDIVRLLIKWPDGLRTVRRFRKSETVEMIYAYCHERKKINGGTLKLRYGFPPKDLDAMRKNTIADAKLSSETIQAGFS